MPGADLAQRAHDKAHRVVREPPPGPTGVEKLQSTLSFAQTRSFDYQRTLNDEHLRLAATAGDRGASYPPLSRKGKLRAADKKAEGTASPMLRGRASKAAFDNTAFGLYLYPERNAHLAGADFIVQKAHPLAKAKSATFSPEVKGAS